MFDLRHTLVFHKVVIIKTNLLTLMTRENTV